MSDEWVTPRSGTGRLKGDGKSKVKAIVDQAMDPDGELKERAQWLAERKKEERNGK